eukprot:TRINITY_DN103156_c0_g1_i1.p1 TRINITY_DN103156_c0_g1~~TRINITY_DN103156_c0_g1_i1.p1  ORF type:complete len:462 (-),score=31.55 TRINITY_DN103156_c0_g1_i1:29-1381(-)
MEVELCKLAKTGTLQEVKDFVQSNRTEIIEELSPLAKVALQLSLIAFDKQHKDTADWFLSPDADLLHGIVPLKTHWEDTTNSDPALHPGPTFPITVEDIEEYRELVRYCCIRGHMLALRVLVEGLGIRVDSGYEQPLLLEACAGAHLEVIRYLLKKGKVSLSERNQDGVSPLAMACCKGSIPVVRWLIKEAGVSANETATSEQLTPLHVAGVRNDFQLVKWLIEEGGADPSAVDKNGTTLLLRAAWGHQVHIVKWLIEEKRAFLSETVHSEGKLNAVIVAGNTCNDADFMDFLLLKGWWIDHNRSCDKSEHVEECWQLGKNELATEVLNSELVLKMAIRGWIGWSEVQLVRPALLHGVTIPTTWQPCKHQLFPPAFRVFCGLALWILRWTHQGGDPPPNKKRWMNVPTARKPEHNVPVDVVSEIVQWWGNEAFSPRLLLINNAGELDTAN